MSYIAFQNQILPTFKNDNCFTFSISSTRNTQKTVFIGGLHIQITAFNVFIILSETFGLVDCVNINVDKDGSPAGMYNSFLFGVI